VNDPSNDQQKYLRNVIRKSLQSLDNYPALANHVIGLQNRLENHVKAINQKVDKIISEHVEYSHQHRYAIIYYNINDKWLTEPWLRSRLFNKVTTWVSNSPNRTSPQSVEIFLKTFEKAGWTVKGDVLGGCTIKTHPIILPNRQKSQSKSLRALLISFQRQQSGMIAHVGKGQGEIMTTWTNRFLIGVKFQHEPKDPKKRDLIIRPMENTDLSK